jgi:hypothetical protein|tara:strand:- start:8138 stop:8287 length:150 start_codon:yes stop_codon:yes gene_type:complete
MIEGGDMIKYLQRRIGALTYRLLYVTDDVIIEKIIGEIREIKAHLEELK